MNYPNQRKFGSAVVLLIAALGFSLAEAQAPEKEKVVRNSELNTDGLVDALDIGAKEPETGLTTRGMKPARTSGDKGNRDASGAAAPSGRAPLMITFKTGSTELTAEGMSMLSKVSEALQSVRLVGYSFVVEGHADPRGGEGLNQKLSQGRAESVARYLTAQHGVRAERLKPIGRGAAELYDPVRVDAPENRRVTLVTQRP